MSTEGVVLDHAAPVDVHHLLAAFPGADTVLPVILLGKAAARPADGGHADLPEGLGHVLSDALFVGDGAVLAHEDAAIDAAAQMFGKMAVDLRTDGGNHILCVDQHRNMLHRDTSLTDVLYVHCISLTDAKQ